MLEMLSTLNKARLLQSHQKDGKVSQSAWAPWTASKGVFVLKTCGILHHNDVMSVRKDIHMHPDVKHTCGDALSPLCCLNDSI